MSKVFVFLENNPRHLRINYQELHKQLPPGSCTLVVIAEQKPYEELVSLKEEGYCHGYLLPRFSLAGLRKQLQEIKQVYGDITDIITSEEISVSYCGVLKLEEQLGLSDNYDRFVNKDLMKRKLFAANMSDALPKYTIFDKAGYQADSASFLDNLEHMLPYPVFAKPINMVGAIEAKKITNREEFKIWADRAVTLDLDPIVGLPYIFEIDEYIEGELLHCDSLIKNGEILHSFVGRNSVPCADFVNQKPCGSVLLDEHEPETQRIKQFIAAVHLGLGMPKNGVTHLEIFRKNDGSLRFLEIAYRPAGGGIPDLYKKQYSFDLRLAHVLLQMLPDYRPVLTQKGPYTAYMDFPCQEGRVVDILAPKISSEYQLIPYVAKNEVTKAASGIADVCARIIFSNSNLSDLLRDFDCVKGFKPCVMDGPQTSLKTSQYTGAFWAALAPEDSPTVDEDREQMTLSFVN